MSLCKKLDLRCSTGFWIGLWQTFKAVDYFCKTFHLRHETGFWIRIYFCISKEIWHLPLTGADFTQPGKMLFLIGKIFKFSNLVSLFWNFRFANILISRFEHFAIPSLKYDSSVHVQKSNFLIITFNWPHCTKNKFFL